MLLLNDMVRFSVGLPEWYERKLRLWAALKGTNRATLAANIVQARIEANWSDVERELDAIAKHLSITREELEDKWLEKRDE